MFGFKGRMRKEQKCGQCESVRLGAVACETETGGRGKVRGRHAFVYG